MDKELSNDGYKSLCVCTCAHVCVCVCVCVQRERDAFQMDIIKIGF